MNPAEKTTMDKRTTSSGRTVTITLSLPTVVSGLIMLCAGFVGVFSLGILLGRGHNIEARIPQLERIMPQAVHPEQPKIVGQGESRPAGASGEPAGRGTGPETAQAGTQPAAGRSGNPQDNTAAARAAAGPQNPPPDPRNQVMAQGDLAYRDSLKQHAKPVTSKPGSSKQQPPKGKPDKAAKEKADASPQSKQPPADSAADKQGVFNYVYQVAAYKDADMSDKLAAKLKAAGIKARTEKTQEGGGVWYRTVVDFRGSPDDTDGLRTKLKTQGLTRLILRTKVPAR